MHIRYSQPHQPFSQCLPAPEPFQGNPVADGNGKISQDAGRIGRILADDPCGSKNYIKQLVQGQPEPPAGLPTRLKTVKSDRPAGAKIRFLPAS